MSRQREAPELGAACVRMMRALARRAADGELEALEGLAALDASLADYLGQAVAGYREGPAQASWSDIGHALSCTKQAAHERFHDALPPAPAAAARLRPHGMDDWRAAMDQWDLDAEAASNGHATELSEYEAAHPRPQLADFMRHLSHGHKP